VNAERAAFRPSAVNLTHVSPASSVKSSPDSESYPSHKWVRSIDAKRLPLGEKALAHHHHLCDAGGILSGEQ
jgi:hypothetical protein